MKGQEARLALLERRIEELDRVLGRAGLGAALARPVLVVWRGHLLRARDRSVAALNANYGRLGAIQEGPGSPHKPVPVTSPTVPTLVAAREESGGVRRAGPLPADDAPGRAGFDLDGMSGRTDAGHPENRNDDAMAGAVRSTDGRMFAVIGDQQGSTKGSGSVSARAVTAAMRALLAADPSMPIAQVALRAFRAARFAVAAETGTTTLLIMVADPRRGEVTFVGVGDSRAYLVGWDGTTEQVTADHTFGMASTPEGATPEEQPEQYVNRWIGRGARFEPAVVTRTLTGPVTVVLTTDELHDFYPHRDEHPNRGDLGATAASGDPGRAADQLIDNVQGSGSGNKTIIIVRVDPGATPTPGAVTGGPASGLPGSPATGLPGGATGSGASSTGAGGAALAVGTAVVLGLAAVADMVAGHHGGVSAMAAAGVPFWGLFRRGARSRAGIPVPFGDLRAPGVGLHRLGTVARVAAGQPNERVVLAQLPEDVRWVKRGRTPAHPIASVAGAVQFRVLGGPAPGTRLTIAPEAQEFGDLFTVGRHEVVEVADIAPGQTIVRWEDLGPALRDAVLDELAAVTFVPNAKSGNWDGPMPQNVIIGAGGRVVQIDFDLSERFLPGRVPDIERYSDAGMPAMGRGDGSLAAFLRLLLHIHPDIYGRLAESEVVTQLAELLRHRDRLLATALDELALHRTLRDHEWAGQVVAAGRLSAAPGGAEVEESRALAQQLVLRRHGGLGDPQRRRAYMAEAAARADAVEVAPGPRGGHIEHLSASELAARSDEGRVHGVHGYDEATSTWSATVADGPAALLEALLASAPANGPPGHAIALDPHTGEWVELAGTVLGHVRAVLDELREEGRVRPADDGALAAASPGGLWRDHGMAFELADGFEARLAARLAAAGLPPVVVVYVVDPATGAVVADRGRFDERIRTLPAAARREMEEHELAHVRHPERTEAQVWERHGPDAATRAWILRPRRAAGTRRVDEPQAPRAGAAAGDSFARPPVGGRAAGPRGHLVGFDGDGRLVDLGAPAMAGVSDAVLDTVRRLEGEGVLVRAGRGATLDASPRGRWASEGLGFALGAELNARLAGVLAERGLPPLTVVYFLDRERAQVVADKALFAGVRRVDLAVRRALEDHELVHWRHQDADEEAVWRQTDAARWADAGSAEPVLPAGLRPRPLSGVSFEKTLVALTPGGVPRAPELRTVRGGRPRVVLVTTGAGERLVVKHWDNDPATVVRNVVAAAVYRLVGVPAPRTWLAVATEDVADGDRTVIHAGDVVEVAEFVSGGAPGLDTEMQRAQLAAEYVINALLQDWDALRVKRDNLVLHGGRVYRIDFDTAMQPGKGLPADGFRITSSPEERVAQAIYGRLTVEDVLAQFEHLAALREDLLALVPAGDMHRMMTARLDWVGEVVRTRRLPDALLADLEVAGAGTAAMFPGDERGGVALVADRSVLPAGQDGAPEVRRLAGLGSLGELVGAGVPVWVYGYREGSAGRGWWEIGLRSGDAERGGTEDWTPDFGPLDQRRVLSALLAMPVLQDQRAAAASRDEPARGGDRGDTADPVRLRPDRNWTSTRSGRCSTGPRSCWTWRARRSRGATTRWPSGSRTSSGSWTARWPGSAPAATGCCGQRSTTRWPIGCWSWAGPGGPCAAPVAWTSRGPAAGLRCRGSGSGWSTPVTSGARHRPSGRRRATPRGGGADERAGREVEVRRRIAGLAGEAAGAGSATDAGFWARVGAVVGELDGLRDAPQLLAEARALVLGGVASAWHGEVADTDKLLIEMVRGDDYIADPAGEAARLEGLLAMLERLAVRELAGLPGAGEVLADVRARIGDQQAVLRLAESDWSVPFEVWSAAWVEGMLAELTATYPGTPTRLRGAVLQTLLDYFEMDLGEGELPFLADPGWLGGVFATAEPGVRKWLFGNWPDVHQRDQLLRGLAAAATGAPSWFGEMPKRNRSRSWLTTLVRWGADPRLVPHHDAVNALLAGLPARGADGERGRALSAWLDVVAALVRVAPILTGEQRHAGIEEILVRLRGVLARPDEDPVGVLSEAATQVQVAGIGFYLDDIGVHHATGRPLPMPVEAPEWDVLLGHHHVADPAFTATVAHYVKEGGGVEGSEAFWRHWHARLEHLDGRSPVVARERAPPPFVTVVHPAGDPDGAGLRCGSWWSATRCRSSCSVTRGWAGPVSTA